MSAFEPIGEERSCSKCGAAPAFETALGDFRCGRHVTRIIMGVALGSAGRLASQFKFDRDDLTLPPKVVRLSNLVRLLPLWSGELSLGDGIETEYEKVLANAEFDANGEIIGFGKSDETLGMFGVPDVPPPEEPEKPKKDVDARELFGKLGRVVWQAQGNRLRRAFGMEERTDAFEAIMAKYGDVELSDSAVRSTLGQLLRRGRPAPAGSGRMLRQWAESVAIAEVTLDSADEDELAELYFRHEDSIHDFLAAGAFWVESTDLLHRTRRKREATERCVSPILRRLCIEFFDEWTDDVSHLVD